MIQDIRFSLRQLRKNPTFAVLAILTLALGIGANTAMFTVTDSVLIRPLAYANANRLVQLVGKTSENMSWPNYRDVSEQVRGFEATAAYAPDVAIVRTADSGQTVFAPKITSDFSIFWACVLLLGAAFPRAIAFPAARLSWCSAIAFGGSNTMPTGA